MKTVFVLWSGGADSTCLIEKLCADPAYDTVLAGYIEIDNNADKAASERWAIEHLLPHLRRSDKFVWLGTVMSVSFAKTNPRLAWKQIPIWLLAAIEAIHPPVDEVAIGYHKSAPDDADDAAAQLDTIRAIYAAYRPLFHRDPPPLVFPLAALEKREVWAALSPELRPLVVNCEAPLRNGGGFAPCGRCRLCQRRPAALR